MLLMFKVKNFASFRDETILDLRAVGYKDMKSHLIEDGKDKAVKTLAIYGKNASGKSNLISALQFFKETVLSSMFTLNKSETVNKEDRLGIGYSAFMLSGKEQNESEFEIVFKFHGSLYQYGFARYSTSEDNYNIKEEWLYKDNKRVFDREGETIKIGTAYQKELKQYNKVAEDRLYIAMLDYFATGLAKNVVSEFKTYLMHHFNVYLEIIVEGTVKGLLSGVSFSEKLAKDAEYKEKVEKLLKAADVGIKGIEIEEEAQKTSDGKTKYEIYTIHNKYDQEGKLVGETKFKFPMESTGTTRYFQYIQRILDMFEMGGVFIIDELSARLHPILTKYIVDMFQREDNKNAQLIFTTHDVSMMDKTQFRRDEIAFVEKDDFGVSSVYTLSDIKVRSDASFLKDYLAGKYGAIPVIGNAGIAEDEVKYDA